jgi:hypothetical protein
VPRTPVLTVDMVRLAEPRRGEWCARCALPSAIVVTYGLTIGGRPASVETFAWCADCERTWRP